MKVSNRLGQALDKYQDFTKTTAIYPDAGKKTERELCYLFLGLRGEWTEFADSNGAIKEAGDVMWYLSQLCNCLNTTLYLLFNVSDSYEVSNPYEALKKFIRDGKDPYLPLWNHMKAVVEELYYHYNYSVNNPPFDETMEKILFENIDKLTSRQERGVLQGDGDNR